jgi:glycine/D-amino acid oxidase-like deaminating enzyme
MSKPFYGSSYWLDRTPRSRRPSYPRFRGQLTTDVVIVGGGLTGCAVAQSFAANGMNVALLEADRIGRGTTASGTGLVWPDPGVDFQSVAKLHGIRAARRIFQACRRSALEAAATIRRLGLRADLEERTALRVALQPDDATRLQRETQARRDAGLEVGWLTDRRVRADTALDVSGAMTLAGAAQFDPYRTSLGLAHAAAERGALIFEQSRVGRIHPRRKLVEIRTSNGIIQADVVIVATGSAGPEFRSLQRHLKRSSTYVVLTEPMPAAMRRAAGKREAIVRDSASPEHSLGWTKDDRIIICGASQPVQGPRMREKTLVQRTGQLMYELSRLYPEISGLRPAYGWDATVADTPDGVPFIGTHRNFPRHLFALGFGSIGSAHAFLAARILLRAYRQELEPGDEQFAFARIL